MSLWQAKCHHWSFKQHCTYLSIQIHTAQNSNYQVCIIALQIRSYSLVLTASCVFCLKCPPTKYTVQLLQLWPPTKYTVQLLQLWYLHWKGRNQCTPWPQCHRWWAGVVLCKTRVASWNYNRSWWSRTPYHPREGHQDRTCVERNHDFQCHRSSRSPEMEVQFQCRWWWSWYMDMCLH